MNREPRRQRTYFILLLVTAFALLTIDYHSNGASSPLHPLEKLVAGIAGPGETAVNSLVKPITDEVHFGKPPDKIAELEKELDAAKAQAELSQNDHRQVEQFDKLLGWPPYYVMRMKPARVVGTGDTLSNDSSVTIAMGSSDGLHINMTVVTGLGLIGNVTQVSATTATVQLLIDPGIYVRTKNARTNVEGYVQGDVDGDGNLTLYQISQTSDIEVGDPVVTYGSDNNEPYVPNIPVGKVISVQNIPGAATHTAIVAPFASFDALDLVFVIFAPTTPVPHGFLIPPITAAPTTTKASPTVVPSASAPNPSASVIAPSTGTSSQQTGSPTTTPVKTATTTVTSTPVTSKPATSQPATSKPATSKPATSKPATSKPATSKPATTPTKPTPTTTKPRTSPSPPQITPTP